MSETTTPRLQISSLKVDNFKSLVDFELNLAKFTCLIGLNGSGKSTVLQLMDFLSQQVRGDLKEWLGERGWQSKDIASRLTGRKLIEFEVTLSNDAGNEVAFWKASFNPTLLRCTAERIKVSDAELTVEGGKFRIDDLHGVETQHAPGGPRRVVNGGEGNAIDFKYQGSILSQLLETSLSEQLKAFKVFFENVKSLDLLAPQFLRQRTRESAGSLGLGGQRLSAFLHELGATGRQKLTAKLKHAYKQLVAVETTSLRSGWKQLGILEHFGKKGMETEARHINDGMLRLIAILAELQTEHQFVLFDEIENGINPELVEFVLQVLLSAKQQVLVTTHSPMILNYLDDEVARRGVMYLYKTKNGDTHAIPFFTIPSLAEKLKVMGPGEAFVDTNLMELPAEISRITEGA